VLIPIVLGATWIGTPYLTIMIVLMAGGMAWEWTRLIDRLGRRTSAWLAIVLAMAAVAVAGFVAMWAGVLLAVLGIIGYARLLRRTPGLAAWSAAGLFWTILPCIGFVWLRDAPVMGKETVGWILILVWAIDTAAYAAGRMIGGPKLAPRISPKKTWSGLAGGVLAAMIVGLITAWLTAPSHWWHISALSGVLAVIEQAGDMAESYAKRRFGVKDSSALIPGHGGLLDRLDGMLAVVAAVALFSAATGVNVLTWR
jgi:phosphatidate cytidylyltransferase